MVLAPVASNAYNKSAAMHGFAARQITAKGSPEEERGADAACLGVSLAGDADLFANCAPTALSKKPPPEEAGLEDEGLEVGLVEDALVGVSDFFANWAPTALSKNPPPEEAGLEEDEGLGEEALVGVSDLFANCAPTALSKNPPPEEAGLEEPATHVGNIQHRHLQGTQVIACNQMMDCN